MNNDPFKRLMFLLFQEGCVTSRVQLLEDLVDAQLA